MHKSGTQTVLSCVLEFRFSVNRPTCNFVALALASSEHMVVSRDLKLYESPFSMPKIDFSNYISFRYRRMRMCNFDIGRLRMEEREKILKIKLKNKNGSISAHKKLHLT